MANENDYLNEQIAFLKRSTRNNYLIGGALCLVVVAYAVFATFAIAKITNSNDLSDLVLYSTSKNAPALIDSLEKNLAIQAPAVAESLSVSLQEAIPHMRIQAQIAMQELIEKAFDSTATNLTEITSTYLETHEFTLRNQDESVKDYSERVAELLANDFAENLNMHLSQTLGSDLDSVNLSTETVLSFLNHHLSKLATTPEPQLTRTQQLERFLLGYIIKNYLPEAEEPIQ